MQDKIKCVNKYIICLYLAYVYANSILYIRKWLNIIRNNKNLTLKNPYIKFINLIQLKQNQKYVIKFFKS